MPVLDILDLMEALALERLGNDHLGLVAGVSAFLESFDNLVDVVPVDFMHSPPERLEPLAVDVDIVLKDGFLRLP